MLEKLLDFASSVVLLSILFSHVYTI